MFKETERFRRAADNIYAVTPDVCKIDMKPHVTQQALLWYGQPPTTYLNAIDRLYVMPNVTALEGKPVKINRQSVVYLVRDGKTHAIDSVQQFMSLGFDDFDQCIVLRENEFNFIPKGEPM
jgi:hypothetical protein